jgi:flagellar hook protein FlgE
MQAISTATFGVQAAFQRADASAMNILQMGAEGAKVDLVSEVAAAVGAKTDLQANLAVIGTADEMLGALLDIRA